MPLWPKNSIFPSQDDIIFEFVPLCMGARVIAKIKSTSKIKVTLNNDRALKNYHRLEKRHSKNSTKNLSGIWH